jgi:D-arabinose 1-dehydrogenase-like Zn-dependent alcohol dehydrogenase
MKGVILPGGRKVETLEFPDPTPGLGEVVLEIKASGMCGSDLKYYRASGGAASLGFKTSGGPVIAGHEPCGVVAAVGPGVSDNQARVGMRDAAATGAAAWCPHCSTGWMQLCVEALPKSGATGHGAHARYMKCPARTLVPFRWCP